MLFQALGKEYALIGDAQGDSVLAAFGVLTKSAWDSVTVHFAASYLRAAAREGALAFRYCLFANESNPLDLSKVSDSYHRELLLRVAPVVRVVELPATHAWSEQNQCVLKILLWLSYARRTFASASFVGYLDRDTWVEPHKLAVFLRAAAEQVVGGRPACVGLIEHAHGYNESSGRYTGFSAFPPQQINPRSAAGPGRAAPRN